MEIFKENDKSKAACEHCKKITETTFQVRTANIQDGNKTLRVPNILVAVCDTCDKTAAVPQQSFAAVAEVKKKAESKVRDFRVPRHFLDILNNSIRIIGLTASKDLRGRIVRHYLAELDPTDADIKLLKKKLNSELLMGKFKRSNRLPMRFSAELEDRFENVIESSHLTKTEVLDSVIVRIKEEILDKKDSDKIDTLRTALIAN